MVQFIAEFGHFHFADSLAVRGRVGINIHDQDCIVQFAGGRIQRRDERVFFRRSLHRQAWRRIKRGIGFQ
jgi:hypothetical protein